MLSEHNPIAELVHQIQKKWVDDISPFPHLKLVRWLIKPEEARLYEGFLKLESTEHGAIPEMLVAMLSPFKDETEYSRDIINDWIKAFREDAKTHQKLNAKGIVNTWQPEIFLSETTNTHSDADQQLLKMLSSFHQSVPDKSMRLVLALFPHSIHSMQGFIRWLNTMLKMGIPHEISFMIFDHIGENYFDSVFEKHPEITRSLHVNLDMDGAIGRIAKMGDPNSPEVKFRECILEMGKALQKNNQPLLHEWGAKGLQVTRLSGFKGMFATAHIVYAGMLFNYKQFDKIDSLLNTGLAIARQGLKAEDNSCKPLIIQFYGYIASSKQLQKKMTEAIGAFEKQGDMASEYKLPGMALTPYYQACTLSKKHLPQRYDELIQKAFSTGHSLEKEEQLNSCFAGVAYDFFIWLNTRQQWDEADKTDKELIALFGTDWKEQAKNAGIMKTANPKNQVSVK